jgi:hypothetical protein
MEQILYCEANHEFHTIYAARRFIIAFMKALHWLLF